MDRQMADYIVECLGDEGYSAEIREDYVGRGMRHGVLGIVTDAPAVLIGFFAGSENASDYPDEVTTSDIPTRQDSMGLKRIYY